LNLEAVFKNAEEAANQFCKKLSKITGFDRTIIYRFEGDKSGVIIGESTSPGMESYLGLHFPATDIPETMRRLYLKQPLLYIPDVHYQAVSLVPEGKHLVDLTESLLRAVSPGYLDYLHKMGISSSLSVAIRYKNALWGLITFQHKQAKKLSPPYRLGIVLLAKSLGRALIMIDKTRQIKNLQKNIIQSAKLTTIGQLAAGVAHEINNPLSYVVNNIYLIQSYFGLIKTAFFAYSQVLDDLHKTPGFNKSKQYEDIMIFNQENKLFTKLASLDDILSETIEGSIRLKQIVSNLTVFSGGSHEEPEYVDINALIEAAIKLTWNEVKYKSTLVKNLNEIPKVYVVPEHLELVFVNLLLNAVQAIETKGEIKISSSRLGSNILVTVSDTGCGIPSENIPKLFTPFFTTKALGSSIGLGLANAYGLIDRLGGKMTVTTKVGRGSTFSILVPINKTE
jgi:light-regulated signal transduction histidine kinase (bacteriophytochrome)